MPKIFKMLIFGAKIQILKWDIFQTMCLRNSKLFYAFFWVSFMSVYIVFKQKTSIFWMITHLCMPQVAKWYCCSNAIYHRIHTHVLRRRTRAGKLARCHNNFPTQILRVHLVLLYFETQIFLPFQEFFYEENEARQQTNCYQVCFAHVHE